ncbi:DUF4013 domain-containing protein [Halohasta salina]|uniref:DUF4013 domain-containing protein n=1 Tax=Halohasta salina TaxID=2961621 RepID=UPI0020A5B1F9|nr:DUF4013 domain-containing protein [Halohasta salina]
MLSESLRVPYRTDDAIGTTAVGSVLTALVGIGSVVWIVLLAVWLPVGLAVTPVVALPSLVLRGYLLDVVDGGVRGQITAPSFVRWGSLARRGAGSALLSAVYLLPAAVCVGLVIGAGVATVVSPPGFEGALQALTGVVIMVAGFGLLVYGLVYLYVRPAARAVFATTGSVRAALGVRRVARVAVTADYLTGWLIAMGVLAVGPALLLPLFVVAGVVGVVSPPAGALLVVATLLLGVVSGFVFRVSAAWSTGRGAATGLETQFPAATATDDEPGVTPRGRPTPDGDTPGEAIAPVQTGRTVGKRATPEPEPEIPAHDAEPTADETADSDAESTSKHDTEATSESDTETDAEATSESDTETDAEATSKSDAESTADEDDSAFVWGVDDADPR